MQFSLLNLFHGLRHDFDLMTMLRGETHMEVLPEGFVAIVLIARGTATITRARQRNLGHLCQGPGGSAEKLPCRVPRNAAISSPSIELPVWHDRCLRNAPSAPTPRTPPIAR